MTAKIVFSMIPVAIVLAVKWATGGNPIFGKLALAVAILAYLIAIWGL